MFTLGTGKNETPSPVPLFQMQAGRLDPCYNITVVTTGLFILAEICHGHPGQLVSMSPLSGNRGICSHRRWGSSGNKTRAPICTPRPASPPAATTESEEERNHQPRKTQKRNPLSPEIMESKSILLLLGNFSPYDSEATQFNRVPIIIIKVPASFFTNFQTD